MTAGFLSLGLFQDEDVIKQTGVIPYALSYRTRNGERHLSIRAFSEQMKRRIYEKQGHKCPSCVRDGIETKYAFEEIQGDHKSPGAGVRPACE